MTFLVDSNETKKNVPELLNSQWENRLYNVLSNEKRSLKNFTLLPLQSPNILCVMILDLKNIIWLYLFINETMLMKINAKLTHVWKMLWPLGGTCTWEDLSPRDRVLHPFPDAAGKKSSPLALPKEYIKVVRKIYI